MADQTQSRFWGWIGAIVAAILVIWGISAIWGDRNEDLSTSVAPPPADVETAETATTPGTMIGDNDTTAADETATTAPSAGTPAGVDFVITEESELNENPDRYIGSKLAVDGEVNETIGAENRMFTLDTDGVIGGSEVLVLTKATGSGPVEKGAQIRVVGTGRRLQQADLASLETELGYDLDDNLLTGYDQKIVIIAETVAAH